MAPPAEADENKTAMAEWKAARGLMKNFDDRTHALWNWGFTFITGLLAVQSLLLPSGSAGGANTSAITDGVKLAVILVTLILIVTLRQVNKIYQHYQSAANTRALILEKRLNIELSNTIADRHREYHTSARVDAIYIFFAFADAVLGWFVMSSWYFQAAVVGSLVVAVVALVWIGRTGLHYSHGKEDWSFDKVTVVKGQPVQITLTNLSDKAEDEIVIAPGDPIFGIRLATKALDDSGPGEIKLTRSKGVVKIRPSDDYVWYWNTGDAELGTYMMYPSVARRAYVSKMKADQRSMAFTEAKSLGLPDYNPKEESDRWILPYPLVGKLTVVGERKDAHPVAPKPGDNAEMAAKSH